MKSQTRIEHISRLGSLHCFRECSIVWYFPDPQRQCCSINSVGGPNVCLSDVKCLGKWLNELLTSTSPKVRRALICRIWRILPIESFRGIDHTYYFFSGVFISRLYRPPNNHTPVSKHRLDTRLFLLTTTCSVPSSPSSFLFLGSYPLIYSQNVLYVPPFSNSKRMLISCSQYSCLCSPPLQRRQTHSSTT
jgi:hypothetical protein